MRSLSKFTDKATLLLFFDWTGPAVAILPKRLPIFHVLIPKVLSTKMLKLILLLGSGPWSWSRGSRCHAPIDPPPPDPGLFPDILRDVALRPDDVCELDFLDGALGSVLIEADWARLISALLGPARGKLGRMFPVKGAMLTHGHTFRKRTPLRRISSVRGGPMRRTVFSLLVAGRWECGEARYASARSDACALVAKTTPN